MGGNGVFAPVKNDIETDVDLEQVKMESAEKIKLENYVLDI